MIICCLTQFTECDVTGQKATSSMSINSYTTHLPLFTTATAWVLSKDTVTKTHTHMWNHLNWMMHDVQIKIIWLRGKKLLTVWLACGWGLSWLRGVWWADWQTFIKLIAGTCIRRRQENRMWRWLAKGHFVWPKVWERMSPLVPPF